MKFLKIVFFIIVFYQTYFFAFEKGMVFTNFLGYSESFNSSFLMNLEGRDNIRMSNAKWRGNSMKDSLYYAMKLDFWKNHKAWGLEWVHHKTYLKNRPQDIQHFSLSDGYNLLYLNRTFKVNRFKNRFFKNSHLRFGFGLVFGHPDVRIEGRERFFMKGGIEGSYLCGVTSQIAFDKWVWELPTHFLTLETKFSASWARPPVSENRREYAVYPNYAIHFILGVGNKPKKPNSFKEGLIQYLAPPLYMGGAGFIIDKSQG